jgi:hypothetical protein
MTEIKKGLEFNPETGKYGDGAKSIEKNGIQTHHVIKKFLSNFLFAVFLVGIAANMVSCHRGNGEIITTAKTVSSFEKIHISSSADVNYYPSEETRVTVTVDNNLLKYVKIIERNNELHIGTKNGNCSFTKFVVDIYCPRITGVSVSGSGSFDGKDKIIASAFKSEISGSGNLRGTFECGDFSAHISGSGKIDGQVECNNLSTKISGSGKIIIRGEAKNSNVNISGSGSLNGREFKTDNADIGVSGSGNVHIWVVDYLKARISGSGDIIYRGTPEIDFSGSGSGRIKSE